ncbi:MAG: hypothetical protein GY940_39025 [bacterium]|nr:hypothetical protein [bacterium]
MKNKRLIYILLLFIAYGYIAIPANAANGKPDFTVSDIIVKPDRFIYIQLKNLSNVTSPITPPLKEKVFLTIYIDDLKRSEYKIKYIGPKLFRKKGNLLFRTNFRLQKKLKVTAEVNSRKVIPESRFSNNRLTKRLTPKSIRDTSK